ncbi:hypothetical protein L3X38_016322 [Prunus dulcis]|uniref:Uncharacterized protein n=1 Tax=Prunus dulcis TaxID=3755 RepID=A0AAD4W565_PRUDU|nr:hypothetical protein L3X38_016322 [Prunus dulcis]
MAFVLTGLFHVLESLSPYITCAGPSLKHKEEQLYILEEVYLSNKQSSHRAPLSWQALVTDAATNVKSLSLTCQRRVALRLLWLNEICSLSDHAVELCHAKHIRQDIPHSSLESVFRALVSRNVLLRDFTVHL